jgi:hypothetical protein
VIRDILNTQPTMTMGELTARLRELSELSEEINDLQITRKTLISRAP